MVDLGTPARDGRLGALGQPFGHRLQFGSAGLGRGNKVAIEQALFVLPAALFDGAGPLLGQTPTVTRLMNLISDRRLARWSSNRVLG